MGEYLFPVFNISSNAFTRFLFAPFLRTRKLYDGLHALNVQHEYVIQDFYMDWNNVGNFLDRNSTGAQIYPVWLCPIKATTAPQKFSSHYRYAEQILLNVGLYGIPTSHSAVDTTRELERSILNTVDRKMLYAQTFWTEKEFWQKYDRAWYANLREKYQAPLLRDIWTKIYTPNKALKSRVAQGILRMLWETIQGKNVKWK